MEEQLLDEKNHRSSCGLCFERYSSARQAKLLICFHSFCLPCLEVLAEQASKNKETSEWTKQKSLDSSNADYGKGDNAQPLAFPCPICRKDIIIPPGGVIQFQSNFYIEDSNDRPPLQPTPCEFCDVGSDAVFWCKECQKNFCSECDRLHRKCKLTSFHVVQPLENNLHRHRFVQPETRKLFQSQIKIVEAALVCMGEEENEMEEQRELLFAEIGMLGNTLMMTVRQAQQETERTVERAAQRMRDELTAEMTKARYVHGLLNRAVQNDVSVNQALLGDDEVLSYKQRASCREQKRVYFRRNVEQTPITLNSILPFFGNSPLEANVTEEEITQTLEICTQQRNTFLENVEQTAQLNSSLSEMNSKMADIKRTYSSLEDNTPELLKDNKTLQNEKTERKSNGTQLCTEVTSLHIQATKAVHDVTGQHVDIRDLSNEFKCLQSEYSQLKDENKALQTEIFNLQKETSLLKFDITNMQQSVSSLNRVVASNPTKLNTTVAFHARLRNNSRVKINDVIINDEVFSNIGGGYAAQTGIFTAPVRGTYLFIATAGAGRTGEEVNFAIRQDKKNIAYGFCMTSYESDCTCTAHAVLELTPGQEVCMVANSSHSGFSENESFHLWGAFTHFSGLLLQVNS